MYRLRRENTIPRPGASIGRGPSALNRMYNSRNSRQVHSLSLVIRIAACYDWLLIVLLLALGAYTCKCLDYYLSIGVQNALSLRAKEISSMFAATGQIPARPGSIGPGFQESFVSRNQRGGSPPDFSGKTEPHMVVSGNVGQEPHPLALPTRVVRHPVRGAGFLVATESSTFGSKEYVVEVKAAKKPIKAVFRQSAITMLIGLVVGLALATLGSFFLVKRALVPVQKIALAVQALPVIRSDQRNQEAAVFEQIENVCLVVNEMTGRLEDSFQIGVGLPAEAFHAPGNRLGTIRRELAKMFENERQSIGVAKTVLCLLKEAERLSNISRNLATPSCQPGGQTRTERLRFYLGGLAISGAEHVCVLCEELGAELTSESRNPSNKSYLVRW
jgi:hypothetical protein